MAQKVILTQGGEWDDEHLSIIVKDKEGKEVAKLSVGIDEFSVSTAFHLIGGLRTHVTYPTDDRQEAAEQQYYEEHGEYP